MKLVWSPETASKAYIDTVKSCKRFKDSSGVAELLSATAAGWNAKFIVESWARGGPIATSVGLAVAARSTGGRHVCIVSDENSRLEYAEAMQDTGVSPPPEMIVGEAEAMMPKLEGLDFLVVDCRRREFAGVLRRARVSPRGAVLACKNACQRNVSWFRWKWVLERGVRVVRSVFLPVGKGLDIAYIGSPISTETDDNLVASNPRKECPPPPSRWIRRIDQRSGEEHVFREQCP